MELKLFDTSTGSLSTRVVDVSDHIFAQEFNESLIHQVVQAYRAGGRQGTKAQKTRAEVSGGGRKPWRQKGTGNARAGTNRSPIWRSGGVTFAAKPRSYTQKINKKMYAGAMRSIVAELYRQNRLLVVDEMPVTGKTRDLSKKLDALKINHALFVTEDISSQLFLAARNLPRIEVCEADELNPLILVAFDKIIMSVPALKKIEKRLQ